MPLSDVLCQNSSWKRTCETLGLCSPNTGSPQHGASKLLSRTNKAKAQVTCQSQTQKALPNPKNKSQSQSQSQSQNIQGFRTSTSTLFTIDQHKRAIYLWANWLWIQLKPQGTSQVIAHIKPALLGSAAVSSSSSSSSAAFPVPKFIKAETVSNDTRAAKMDPMRRKKKCRNFITWRVKQYKTILRRSRPLCSKTWTVV